MYIVQIHVGEGDEKSVVSVKFVFPINQPISPVKCLLINKKTIFS